MRPRLGALHRDAVPGRPRPDPWRRHTPAGPVTIDLLRRLDRSAPSPPRIRSAGPATGDHHERGERGFALVATRPAGGAREVLGRLELRLYDDEGDGGRLVRGTVDRVVVQEDRRRIGIGTQLLRAAIGLARADGIAALRGFIPNLLVLEDGAATCHWALYEPAAHELGGIRSLGATARACALERLPCLVVGATRETVPLRGGGRQERVGGIIEVPIVAPPPGARAAAPGAAALLARLQAEIALLARVPWPAGAPATTA